MSKLLQKLKAEYKALEMRKVTVALGTVRLDRPWDEELIDIQNRMDEIQAQIEAELASLAGATLTEWMEVYLDFFGENFPYMVCRGMSDEEVCAFIQNCLHSNRPFRPQLDDDTDY